MSDILLVNANSLQIPLADKSVQMVCCSPPYWGLRSYNTGPHKHLELGSEPLHDCLGWATGTHCGECYVCHTLAWTREVRRVLRDDGVFFLNLGDSYNGSGGAGGDYNAGGLKEGQPRYAGRRTSALKPKDLCMIPARVALALQADGWFLRSEITWCKRNPMPESVSDRPTSATEKIFLLSKSPRYFFDAEAVREGFADERMGQDGGQTKRVRNVGGRTDGFTTPSGWTNEYGNTGRNVRNFWLLSSEPFPGAHFATFPTEIPRRAIKAGTSEAGCCSVCGAQWVRVTERQDNRHWTERRSARKKWDFGEAHGRNDGGGSFLGLDTITIGFQPSCKCNAPTKPATVLDPFAGSGTTLQVARQLGRNAIGLDLSYTYLHDQARARLELDKLDAWTNGRQAEETSDLGPLFGGAA